MAEISFNHATVRERADMLEFVALCADRNLRTVSIWGDEVDKVGERAALTALREHGMSVSGYNRIGPFTPDGVARAEGELERAARFAADHVFLFTGGIQKDDRCIDDARRRAEETIEDILELARKIGVKLAVEPLHPMLAGDRAVISSLSHANDICERLGPGIGVVVDAYHVWWDERLAAELDRAGRANRILGFHVNDWLVPTRDILTDRGMMGDGVIDLGGLDALMRRCGFTGPLEVEIFSEHWWQRDPEEVMDISLERCARIFGHGNAATSPLPPT